jgi:hypothetical protein
MIEYSTNLKVKVIATYPIEKGDVIKVVDKKGNKLTKYVESIKDNYLELESYFVQNVVIKN